MTDPLQGKNFDVPSYQAQDVDAIIIMNKVFSFDFAKDFRMVYGEQPFAVAWIYEDKMAYEEVMFKSAFSIPNTSGGTYYSLKIHFDDYVGQHIHVVDHDLSNLAADELTFRYSHELIIAKREMQVLNPFTEIARGFRSETPFRLIDHNPTNDTYITDSNGYQLNGLCTASQFKKAALTIKDPDSLTLVVPIGGNTNLAFKFSYVPLDEFKLVGK